jgi:hypothetical protein
MSYLACAYIWLSLIFAVGRVRFWGNSNPERENHLQGRINHRYKPAKVLSMGRYVGMHREAALRDVGYLSVSS